MSQNQHINPTGSLSDLLKQVGRPRKTEQEWHVFENLLFAQIDELELAGEKARLETERALPFWSGFWRPAFATAIAAIVVAAVVTIYNLGPIMEKPLADCRILGMRGTVAYQTPKHTSSSSIAISTAAVEEGWTFETGSNSSVCVQLGEGTGIMLAENSALALRKSTTRAVSMELLRGDVLAMVRGREQGQRFEVLSANAKCTVLGTAFRVSADKEATNLLVYKGMVAISHRDEKEIGSKVEAGQAVALKGTVLSTKQPFAQTDNLIHELSLLQLSLNLAQNSKYAAGIVDISSDPSGARVTIDGQNVGNTPLIFKHPVGEYEIALTHAGHQTWQGEVLVRDKQTSHFRPRLALAEQPREKKQSIRPTRSGTSRKQTKEKRPAESNVHRPEYVEALIQMTVGEYRKALTILDTLKRSTALSRGERIAVWRKTSQCYSGLGDFERTLKGLQDKLAKAHTPEKRSSILWQIANVRGTCLADYDGARKDLRRYLAEYPGGAWAEEARRQLSDISYLAENN